MTDMPRIQIVIDTDGEVMLSATGTVAWLHWAADKFADGALGGNEEQRDGAHEALHQTANVLQSGYVDAAADTILERWGEK